MLSDTQKIEMLKQAFGDPRAELDGRGENLSVVCPNRDCGSRIKGKRKLAIRLNDFYYHCWVCGIKGRRVSWLIRKYKPDSLKFLPDSLVEAEGAPRTDDVQEEAPTVEMPSDSELIYETIASETSSRSPDFRDIVNYLASRDIDLDTALRHRLCWSRDGGWRRRVVLPSFDAAGKLNYVVSRRIDRVDSGRSPYYNYGAKSSDVVFNELDVEWDEPIVLVEGPFDHIRASRVCNSVPLLGSSLPLSSALFRRVVGSGAPVVLCLDADARKKAEKIAGDLYSYNVDVAIASLPDGLDPGSVELGLDSLRSCLGSARPYSPNDRLRAAITSIRSGSIL